VAREPHGMCQRKETNGGKETTKDAEDFVTKLVLVSDCRFGRQQAFYSLYFFMIFMFWICGLLWIHIRAIPCPYVRTKTVFLLMCNASKTQWHRSTAFARGDDVREIIGLTERKMDSYLAVGN